jgi:hypothetical protein
MNPETPSVEGSVLTGSNNYQHEGRIEDMFCRHHCERRRLESGATAARKYIVKYLQLADCRETVDKVWNLLEEIFSLLIFKS